MPVEKIAAAYIRVSTEDQLEYSPNAQLAEIHKYAAVHGYVIPDAFIYMDEGISGKQTIKRDAFNQMIGMAKRKPRPFDAILLWKFSRFARNREDSIVYKSMLRKQLGIDVISISEPVGDDKMSIIIEAMIEAMDEYYSLNLAEEVKRGMTEKARRGGLQATPAFGYRVENNILVPVPEEAALVESVFHKFIAGEGLSPIARWLNAMGVTTHRGNRFENRTIEYILMNPVYIGKLRWNPSGKTRREYDNEHIILSDAAHASIISPQIWEAAQRRMAEVKARWRYHARPLSGHKDWLSGLVRCASCNRTLIFTKPHYWKCNGYAHGSCHTAQHIRDETLKSMILERLKHDAASNARFAYRAASPRPEVWSDRNAYTEQLRQIRTKLTRLRDAYLSGIETLERYGEIKAALEQQAAAIESQLQALDPPADTKKADALHRERIRSVAALLESSECSMEEKHMAIHSIVEACVFNKSANSILLTYRLFTT